MGQQWLTIGRCMNIQQSHGKRVLRRRCRYSLVKSRSRAHQASTASKNFSLRDVLTISSISFFGCRYSYVSVMTSKSRHVVQLRIAPLRDTFSCS
jgi:hypothetical protein